MITLATILAQAISVPTEGAITLLLAAAALVARGAVVDYRGRRHGKTIAEQGRAIAKQGKAQQQTDIRLARFGRDVFWIRTALEDQGMRGRFPSDDSNDEAEGR